MIASPACGFGELCPVTTHRHTEPSLFARQLRASLGISATVHNQLSASNKGFSGTLQDFLKMLADWYPYDILAPGVHFAWLEDKQQWYASVKRFTAHGFRTRAHVEASAYAPYLFNVLEEVIKTWNAGPRVGLPAKKVK